MRTLNLFRQLPVWLLGAALCMGGVATIYAVDEIDLFQLDGNPSHDGGVGGDDWETLYNGGSNDGGSAVRFTGIQADPPDATIFSGGGSKDINDISSWLHKNGSVSQKSDITNAYAAAYIYPGPDTDEHKTGDLIIYMGADRLDNEGDTFMGFWFFQNSISLDPVPSTGPGGTFNELHVNDDVLVLMNFPQANNAVPEIKVIKWDDSCSKAANNNPQPNECAAQNLRLIASQSAENAVCTPGGVDQVACAITNLEGTPNDGVASPWPYVSAEGDVNAFPFETIFSGGINLSNLLPESSGCFSSFMAETRSSKEYTASLEDFSLDEFQLCAASAVTDIFNETQDKTIPIEDPLNDDSVVGDSIHDNVTITGTALGSSTSPDPASPPDVTFVLFDNGTCTPAVDDDEDGFPDVPATDANVLDVSTASLVGGTPDDGIATAQSDTFVLTQTGAHSYRAFWDGDENYPDRAISACEPFAVIQPQLTIRKEILSCADDGGEFTVSVDGTTAFNALLGDLTVASTTDGDTVGPKGLAPATYTVREVVQDAYVAVYDGVLSDCAAGANGGVQSVVLAGLDDKTCTFLNVRKPQVTVIKKIVGTAGTFDLFVGATEVVSDGGDQSQGSTLIHTLVGSNFGTPTVSEVGTGTTSLANYSTIIQCDDGTSGAWDLTAGAGARSVTLGTLAPGDHVTCTITNISPDLGKACLSTP